MFAISPDGHSYADNMGQVTIRNSRTSQAFLALSPLNDESSRYTIGQINLGSNSMSRLEIVSSLNVLNLGHSTYEYFQPNRTEKYNPKVYFSAVQSVAFYWTTDVQNGQNWEGKSGSWPYL